jgi:putative hemolysin
VALAEPLVEPLDFLGGAAEPAAIVLVTLVLAYVTLVFGELAPKRVAMQRAERWGLVAARPLAAMARLARPVIWLLGVSTDLAVRLVGGDPSRRGEDVTEEELRDLVASQTAFSPEQRTIISGAFEIGHRTLREVLVPRPDVKALDADRPAASGSLSRSVTPERRSWRAISIMSSGWCTSVISSTAKAGWRTTPERQPPSPKAWE